MVFCAVKVSEGRALLLVIIGRGSVKGRCCVEFPMSQLLGGDLPFVYWKLICNRYLWSKYSVTSNIKRNYEGNNNSGYHIP